MADLVLDTTSQTTRAWLVKRIGVEQDHADYWAKHPGHADALAEARCAIARYMALLAEGDRDA